MKMRNAAVFTALTVALGLGIASTQDTGKIKIWTDFKEGELKWFTAAAKAFEATPAAKGAKLELTSVILGETRDKFIQAAPKGEGPDLIATIPHDQIGEFVSAVSCAADARYHHEKQKDRRNRSASTQASSTMASGVPRHLSRMCRWLSSFRATPQ